MSYKDQSKQLIYKKYLQNYFTFKVILFLTLLLILFSLKSFANEEVEQRLEKKLLIVGCGRSGTNFMCFFLQGLGLDVGHERLMSDGCVSWWMTVRAPGRGRPFDVNFEHIFHQVRDPLHVITSCVVNFAALETGLWSYIRTQIPEIREDDTLLVHCAKYWYYWNLKAEEISEWRYRIEDLEYLLPEFESRLNIPVNKIAMFNLPKNINTWFDTTQKITWNDLKESLSCDLFQAIQEMASRYGYVVVDEMKPPSLFEKRH